MFSAGIGIERIARHFDCPRAKVVSAIDASAYTSFFLDRGPEGEIVREYLGGRTMVSLSLEYNLNDTEIKRILKKNGCVTRTKEISIESVILDYKSGVTATKLAEIHGVPASLIKTRLEDNNTHILSASKRQRKHFWNEDFFADIDNQYKAYWLGFMFADGNVSSRLQSIKIALNSKDRGHLEKFCRDLDYVGPGAIFESMSKTSYGDSLCSAVTPWSRKLCLGLIGKGCVPNKTYLDPSPMDIPSGLARHFIRGVVDGDGGIYLYPNAQSLEVVGSRNLLEYIVDNVPFQMSELQKHKSIWRVRTCAEYSYEVIEWLYSDCEISLDRKQARADEVFARGKKIGRRHHPEEEIALKYSEGYTVAALARENSCDWITVERILKRHDVEIRPRLSKNTVCSHPGCEKAPRGKFCHMHYDRLRKGQDMDAPERGKK